VVSVPLFPEIPVSKPVFDPDYWKRRLERAKERDRLHLSVFEYPEDGWKRIEDRHREILREKIGKEDSVLDCGCAYGRLLTLLPRNWEGYYCGVDLSPDFIQEALKLHPGRRFLSGDLRNLPQMLRTPGGIDHFQWAIFVSVRPVVRGNMGQEEWDNIEHAARKVANKLLFLEYDEDDKGSVE
jgi:SAM-dependent methyltransferase